MIPWGIDLAEFVPGRKASLHVRLQILTLRAHEPLYSVETVINAAKILQDRDCDVELVIGNTGSLTNDLTALASDLGLSHVSFVGEITESDLPKYFNNADVYVSAAQTDGTSVTLLQAMNMKVPVVVSDSPGNVALLTTTDETGNFLRRGALFHTNNAESLATTLENFGSDPSLIEKQVIAAWEYVQTHADWNQNIQRLLPLLHSR
jgi:glycosyltransferase involved in cell wall biosynthesis